MSVTYSINITLDNDTLAKLSKSGQSLRAYKGVRGSVGDGFSALWFTTTNFSQTVNIQWDEEYGGYVDNSVLKPGNVINTGKIQDMKPGYLLSVNSSGITTVTTNGTAGELDIKNTGTTELICGAGQKINNNMSPLCALPLYGNDFRNITPLEKILLNFDYGIFQTGTIVEKAWIKSILIDFSQTGETELSVSYNIDKGWDAQAAVWAQINTDTIEIAGTLNESPSRLRPS